MPHPPLVAKLSDRSFLKRAYRLLAKREYSAWELRRKLKVANNAHNDALSEPYVQVQKPLDEAREKDLDRLLAELIERDEQSDLRFVEQRCRWRYGLGWGPIKIRYELEQHQIKKTVIEKVLAEYEPRWESRVDEVRRKKFSDTKPMDKKERAKQAHFLQQRGFVTEPIEPDMNE